MYHTDALLVLVIETRDQIETVPQPADIFKKYSTCMKQTNKAYSEKIRYKSRYKSITKHDYTVISNISILLQNHHLTKWIPLGMIMILQ